MGTEEEKIARRRKNKKIQSVILATIATTGLVATALVAPNVIGALAKLGYLPHKRDEESIKRARQRLVEKGLLEYKGGFFRITHSGEIELRKYEISIFKHRKPKRWDKKWRVLIFDIPDKRKGLRDRVRKTLVAIGFTRLQDSVWVYPYNCEDLLALLKADFKIGKDLRYLIVESIENDQELKTIFGLQ